MTRFVFGATFVVIAAVALTVDREIDRSTAWLWAVGLAGLGIAGVVSSVAAIVGAARQRAAARRESG